MKHLKLYEEYNSLNESVGTHPSFVKTEDEAIEFLEANNINTDYCKIYNEDGIWCVDIDYSEWYEDEINGNADVGYESAFEEYVDKKLDKWHDEAVMGDYYHYALESFKYNEKEWTSEIHDAMKEKYPELVPPNEDDYDDQDEYEKDYKAWDDKHFHDYEDVFRDYLDEMYIFDIEAEMIENDKREARSQIESEEEDSFREDFVNQLWDNLEDGRTEIEIRDYSPNPKGFLPIKLNSIDAGSFYSGRDSYIYIYDLISTVGLEDFDSSYNISEIDSKLLTYAGDLDSDQIDYIRNAPIFSEEGIPTHVIRKNVFLDAPNPIEEFKKTISEYDPNDLIAMFKELEARDPDTHSRVFPLIGMSDDDLEKWKDRYDKGSKYKGVIKF